MHKFRTLMSVLWDIQRWTNGQTNRQTKEIKLPHQGTLGSKVSRNYEVFKCGLYEGLDKEGENFLDSTINYLNRSTYKIINKENNQESTCFTQYHL